jgi:hypothetical protein
LIQIKKPAAAIGLMAFMNAKEQQSLEPGSRSHLVEVIEADDRTIKDYLSMPASKSALIHTPAFVRRQGNGSTTDELPSSTFSSRSWLLGAVEIGCQADKC